MQQEQRQEISAHMHQEQLKLRLVEHVHTPSGWRATFFGIKKEKSQGHCRSHLKSLLKCLS